ncbi:MAG: 6-bladed beta-propeller [Gemmatimonadota bacterium]
MTACNTADDKRPGPLAGLKSTIKGQALSEATVLDTRETLRLTAANGDYAFFRIASVVPAANGDIYVLDVGNEEVIVFNAQGKLLRRFGRAGHGPGEFLTPRALALADDTVFVLDRRLHAFSTQGKPLYSINAEQRHGYLGAVSAFAHTTEGLMLGRTSSPQAPPTDGSPQIDTIRVWRRSRATGLFLDSAVVLPGQTAYPRGRGLFFPLLFGSTPHFAITPNSRLLYSRGDEYALDILSSGGEQVMLLQGDVPRIRLRRSEYDRAVRDREHRSQAGSHSNSEHSEDASRYYRTLPRPRYRAVLGRILAGDDETVLIERLDLGPFDRKRTDAAHWDIVQLSGEIVGRFVMPTRLEPLAYRAGQLYGIERNEFHAPEVVRFTIVSPAAKPDNAR